ncbi:hypothetical protein HDU76_004220 [Blyttiomyces sp. JEL0837]|nr:hypothetical protein HDU76_004220 [Blyttiomyces sp. JEL0837]
MTRYNDQNQPMDPNAPLPLLQIKPKFEPWDKTGMFAIIAEIAAYILLTYGVYLLSTGAYVAIKVQDYLGILSGFSQTLGGVGTLLLWRSLLLPVRCYFKGIEVDVVPDLDKRISNQVKGVAKSAVAAGRDVQQSAHQIVDLAHDGQSQLNAVGHFHQAVGDHGLGNFQSLNAQHHHLHGHGGQNNSNSNNMETVTRTTSTSTRSGINTASAIILGLTIAILASVAITTAIPGLVSPLGILPPTDDNIATAYPNSGIKSGDGSSIGSGGVGGSGGSGSGSGSGGGNNNGTIAGSNGGGNNGTTNGGSTGGSGGNGGSNGGNGTTTPGSGTGTGGTGTGSGGSTGPDTSNTCMCSQACQNARQDVNNFENTVSVTSAMLQCTGAVLQSNFHRLCSEGGLPDPGTFGTSTCNVNKGGWCIYTEDLMLAACEGYPSSNANVIASACCIPASWPLSGGLPCF